MIFGNEIIKENNEEIELVDIYEYMIEDVKKEQDFFNECILSDFMEVKCLREGVEYINEGLIDKIKKYGSNFTEFIKKLEYKISKNLDNKLNKLKELNDKAKESRAYKNAKVRTISSDSYNSVCKKFDILYNLPINKILDNLETNKNKTTINKEITQINNIIDDTYNYFEKQEKNKKDYIIKEIEIKEYYSAVEKLHQKKKFINKSLKEITKSLDKFIKNLKKQSNNRNDLGDKAKNDIEEYIKYLIEYKKIVRKYFTTLLKGLSIQINYNQAILVAALRTLDSTSPYK